MAEENAGWGAPRFTRTFETGSRRLRANRGSLPAANPPLRESQSKLVGLPGESSRSDRCVRLFHRTVGDVQTVVWFLRHRAWTAEDPALQCHATPDSRVGGAAVAGGLSRGWSVSVRHLRSRF